MKHLSFSLLFVSFLAAFSSITAESTDLTSARMAYETKLAVPKGKLDAAVAARGKQYAGIIMVLEDRASLDGKLDAVLLLKAERVAFEHGKWTMGFGANLPKVSPEARDARRSLDADFACLRIPTMNHTQSK